MGLVVLVGTSAGKADDENIAPDLSFYGPPSNDQTGLHAPYGMAFDQDRNLWVVNNRKNNESIVMYDEGSQNQSGTINQPPTVTLKINKLVVGGTRVEGPYSLDFDSKGNLWVGTENVGLMRIPKSRLGKTGQVSPKALKHPPLTKLIESGDVQTADGQSPPTDTGSGPAGPGPGGRHGGTGAQRQSGDR